MCQVHNTRAGTRLSKCYFRRCIIVTPSRNAVTLMLRTTGSSGTRRKTLFRQRRRLPCCRRLRRRRRRQRRRRRRVVKNGLRETASYTRMMVSRVINRPQTRICLGNESKSPRRVVSNLVIRLYVTKRDATRLDGFQRTRLYYTIFL